MHTDREFKCIKLDILSTVLNTAAADDHVREVKQSVQTIKEAVRTAMHSMYYKRIPKILLIKAIQHAARTINMFPANDGLLDTMSLLTLIMGKPIPDYDILRIAFGAYVQVFEDHKVKNGMHPRTTGAIALNPTGNAQGDYYFMLLTTGERPAPHQWRELQKS